MARVAKAMTMAAKTLTAAAAGGAGADGGAGERAAHAGKDGVGRVEQLARYIGARGHRANQDEEWNHRQRVGARQREWHRAEHLQRLVPAIERGIAGQPARCQCEPDRHARENEEQQPDHPQDADRRDAHLPGSRANSIAAAAIPAPIMPASTGIQYHRRGSARSEVTSLNAAESRAATQPCQAIAAITSTASMPATRRNHGTQRGAQPSMMSTTICSSRRKLAGSARKKVQASSSSTSSRVPRTGKLTVARSTTSATVSSIIAASAMLAAQPQTAAAVLRNFNSRNSWRSWRASPTARASSCTPRAPAGLFPRSP